jgi:hypothetical protein
MNDRTTTIQELVELMKTGGSLLAEPVPVDGLPPMTFSCVFATQRVDSAELNAIPFRCPDDLAMFWGLARSARLFEDEQYGQWGLEVLDPQQACSATTACRAQRKKDFIDGDLVIGKFLGDSDLLLIRCDPSTTDFGSVLVAPPLDPRLDWYQVSHSFAVFLEKYVATSGDKFWTKAGRA